MGREARVAKIEFLLSRITAFILSHQARNTCTDTLVCRRIRFGNIGRLAAQNPTRASIFPLPKQAKEANDFKVEARTLAIHLVDSHHI